MITRIKGLAPSHGAQSRPPTMAAAEPLAWLAEAHKDQLALCDSLEAIADNLPEIDREICAYAARMLGPLLRELHAGEEGVVFVWIERRHGDDPALAAMLEQLKYEHCEDECYAEELAEMLARLGAADATVNAETAGYMLRGFFTNVRRHIAFEQECLRGILARHRGEQPGTLPA
ncbi:hemerythrin domain-containing protein [Sinorhizobium fredii]|uniref:hemerythrin domain-containing protein n=1 Tax=Rhizobium fredii TaxID=380 RepID=UPI0005956985|nr:hemerythrin domain-containing protein [Sinorhizobium fredii]WOS61263.1 hemerythrin domain-containing protein [Sinorhizobium fredii GR64]